MEGRRGRGTEGERWRREQECILYVSSVLSQTDKRMHTYTLYATSNLYIQYYEHLRLYLSKLTFLLLLYLRKKKFHRERSFESGYAFLSAFTSFFHSLHRYPLVGTMSLPSGRLFFFVRSPLSGTAIRIIEGSRVSRAIRCRISWTFHDD